MKLYVLFLWGVMVLFVACSGGDQQVREEARKAVEATQPAPSPAPPPPTDGAQPAADAAVKHYICPNNCAGSGGDVQGTCPVCGAAYVHNAAYHNQQPSATPNAGSPQPAPAQNASGEYHYICSAGCGGGAATQGTCPSCGAALVHNQAYHQ